MVSEIHHLDYKGILSVCVHGAWDTKREQLRDMVDSAIYLSKASAAFSLGIACISQSKE